jgi:hypothetical protein
VAILPNLFPSCDENKGDGDENAAEEAEEVDERSLGEGLGIDPVHAREGQGRA